MSRPLRIEFPDAIYQVASRGDWREPIFVDDGNRHALLAVLAQVMDRVDAEVPAYFSTTGFCDSMEQQGLTNRDLEPMIGSRGRVSEVLSGKRRLSMVMVWRLHEGLGIAAETLIRLPRSA